MYGDLYHRLINIDDQAVAEHVRTNCSPGIWMCGRMGYAIIRDGEIVKSCITWIN